VVTPGLAGSVAFPAGLTKLAPVGAFSLTAGDYSVIATVDLSATLPVQQFTCTLQGPNPAAPIDRTPIVYSGASTRLTLFGTVSSNIPFAVTVACSSDAAGSASKTQIIATQVEHINPLTTLAPQ